MSKMELSRLIESRKKRSFVSKWIIGIFTIYILIYLALGHMNIIANAISSWLVDFIFPLL